MTTKHRGKPWQPEHLDFERFNRFINMARARRYRVEPAGPFPDLTLERLVDTRAPDIRFVYALVPCAADLANPAATLDRIDRDYDRQCTLLLGDRRQLGL